MKKLVILLAFSSLFQLAAQDNDIILNHDLYHYIDRLDIQQATGDVIHTDVKPYGRQALSEIMKNAAGSQNSPLETGWFDRMRQLVDDVYADSTQVGGILKRFYTNQRDFYHVREKNFQLYLNPVVHFSGGVDLTTYPNSFSENLPLYINTRGVVVRGTFLDKIGFHTEVADNITRFPQFVHNQYAETGLLYGETFVKQFKEENGLDYFTSRAYITVSPFEQMRIKFGKDRVFWGNGRQSLLFSDFAADHLMLNITTRIWKLEYVNHFTQMIDFIPNKNDQEGTFPRKYAVFHQLSYKPFSGLSVGIFESIVYTPNLANGKRGFEIQYLNPIIFYRSAEQSVGSPDNSFLGLQVKYNFLRRFQLYGQILIDDFNYSRRSQGSGYWGNKLGYQVGVKYIDAFSIPTLDLQAEYNLVRPFTYQHFSVASNYTHYGQHLGHAAGNNLDDIYLGVRYHPFPALNLQAGYYRLTRGLNKDGRNYGGDVNRSYVARARQFNNVVGQGNRLDVNMLYGRLTWQLWRSDVYAEIEGRYRRERDADGTINARSASIIGGIRMNIVPRAVRF